jgi:flagellar basal-body rod protein FlgC
LIAMLGVFSALEVAASGLGAQRVRMNTIASNLANVRTTRTEEGGPYKRLDPLFEAVGIDAMSGTFGAAESGVSRVNVSQIVADQRPGMLVYEPGHPDANQEGYVEYPNVNAVEEMVNMITASRAYEAGVTSIETVKSMARSALGIAR